MYVFFYFRREQNDRICGEDRQKNQHFLHGKQSFVFNIVLCLPQKNEINL